MKKVLLFISSIGVVLVVGLLLLITSTKHPSEHVVLGGVVSHHSLINQHIDEFWDSLSNRVDPQVIILVGPDHQDLAQEAIVYTADKTVFPGYVSLDQDLISQLKILITDDPNVFKSEYSIQIQLPFIYHYFPQVKIIPILFRSDTTADQVIHFARALHSFLAEDTVVVASVDFSHYLTEAEANQNDSETFQALQEFNYSTLSHFGPGHVDSDESLIFLSELTCPNHDCLWEELFHGNSADVDPTDQTATTGYFSLLLERK